MLSKILPFKNDLPDLEGHLNYYQKEFGMNRFLFSYPMYRPDASTERSEHLATLGSSAVDFSKHDLLKMFYQLLELKQKKMHSKIVNPRLSIQQQIEELTGEKSWVGCHAGQDIFFPRCQRRH